MEVTSVKQLKCPLRNDSQNAANPLPLQDIYTSVPTQTQAF